MGWGEGEKERSSAQGASGLAPTHRKQPRNQRDFCDELLLFTGLLSKHLKYLDSVSFTVH